MLSKKVPLKTPALIRHTVSILSPLVPLFHRFYNSVVAFPLFLTKVSKIFWENKKTYRLTEKNAERFFNFCLKVNNSE